MLANLTHLNIHHAFPLHPSNSCTWALINSSRPLKWLVARAALTTISSAHILHLFVLPKPNFETDCPDVPLAHRHLRAMAALFVPKFKALDISECHKVAHNPRLILYAAAASFNINTHAPRSATARSQPSQNDVNGKPTTTHCLPALGLLGKLVVLSLAPPHP